MPPFISAFVERIMSRDADGDGKVTKDELPDRAQQMFDRADRNEDGVLEEGELRQAAQWMRRRLGEGGGRGPRPERPARPPVEENDEA
jgi:Ca2+-binding EF-hand superfamily protein